MAKNESIGIPRAVLELWRFCTDGSVRSNQQAVWLEPSMTHQLSAVATNGHHLLALEFYPRGVPGSSSKPPSGFIPVDICRGALTRAKKKAWWDLELSEGTAKVMRSDGVVSSATYDPSLKFPPWRTIVDRVRIRKESETEAVGALSLNPLLLLNFIQFCKKVGTEQEVWSIPEKPLEPIRIDFQIPDDLSDDAPMHQVTGVYILMPQRM